MASREVRRRTAKEPSAVRGGSGSIIGLRLGALDFMRATEQTAVLMSPAAGRKLHAPTQSQLAIRSIGAFLRSGFYRTRLVAYDHQSGKGESFKLWQSLGFFARPRGGIDGPIEAPCLEGPIEGSIVRPVTGSEYFHISRGEQLPYGPEDHMSLDVCVCPVDGQRALSQGLSGGSAVVLAAGNPGVFCGHELPDPAPDGTDTRTNVPTRPIRYDQAYFVVVMAPHVWSRFQKAHWPGLKPSSPPTGPYADSFCVPSLRGAMDGTLPGAAGSGERLNRGDCFRAGVEMIVSNHAIESGFRDDDIALLDEDHLKIWDAAVSARRACRLFPGSSVALAIAAMRAEYGFAAMMGVTEHVQVCQIAVACRALGGGLIAFPVTRERRDNGNSSNLIFQSPVGVLHTWFARRDDCVLSCSGISAHCIFSGVHQPSGPKTHRQFVETVCLSARTKSYRMLLHEIDMSGTRWCSMPVVPDGGDDEWRIGNQIYHDYEAAIENALQGDRMQQLREIKRH